MTRQAYLLFALTIGGSVIGSASAQTADERERGAKIFGAACAACHSLAPGRHMTGPSLAGIWNRNAGSVPGFTRTSPALHESGIVWNEGTLDAWLADPEAAVPGNWMTFPGLKEPKARADVIAFLKAADAGGAAGEAERSARAAPQRRDLKDLAPRERVTAIRLCRDTYRVTTAGGELPPFWEPNLRFKTDSGEMGPQKGRPAILPAGMLGDRASVIFADPSEIGAFIEKTC